MSAPMLTPEAQLRYLLQWFGEFSELQREDFLPILAAARSDQPDQLAACLANLSCEDKPVSLFQCRIKLFNEWFPSWGQDEQDRLVKGVSDMDPDFGGKLQDALTNGIKLNGDMNGTGEAHSPTEEIKEVSEDLNNGHEEEVPAVSPQNEVEAPAVVQESIPVEIVAAS